MSFTCEELVTGVSNPAFNPSASSSGFQPNWGVPAVPINPPLIYEPPPSGTGGVAQIWVGASGINGGGGSQWGGANVYISTDNVTYSQIAVITAPMRQGLLTASLPAAAGWDSVDTLAVDLAESTQAGDSALTGTSQAAAQAGATLSLIDSELLAYEVATLSSGTAYNLTGLARALSGSVAAGHSSGAQFFRLDGAIIKYNVPANFIGKTIYFKFQIFNVFGERPRGSVDRRLLQLHATIRFDGGHDDDTEHPTNAACASDRGADSRAGFHWILGGGRAPRQWLMISVTWRLTRSSTSSISAPVMVTVIHPIAVQLLSGTLLDLGLTTGAVTVSDDFGSTNDAVMDVINLGTVP